MKWPVAVVLFAAVLGVPSQVAQAARTSVQSVPYDMRLLDSLPYVGLHRFPCGDANRNGRPEVYAYRLVNPRTVFALEYRQSGGFDAIDLGFNMPCLWDFGDADLDGKAELLVWYNYTIHLVERPDTGHFPVEPVWWETLPRAGGPGYSTLLDLDADGAPEVATLEAYRNTVLLFENTGDNAFAFRDSLKAEYMYGPREMVQTHDLDGDGWPELLQGGEGGRVAFYEAVANDTFKCASTFRLVPQSGSVVLAVGAAPDMDRDGRNEAIAYGVHQEDSGTVFVLESPRDDSFAVVAEWRVDGCESQNGHHIAVGDVDGDGVPEFALTDGRYVRLYRCTGNDQYEEVWQAPCTYKPVALYDIDWDGRCELIYGKDWSMVIREYTPSGVAEREAAQLRGVEVSPSVLRPGGRLHLSGLPPGARVELLDVSGRVRFSSCSSLIPLPSSLTPGLFFVRVGSGSHSITRKVLVVE